jgi:hypothetical protein
LEVSVVSTDLTASKALVASAALSQVTDMVAIAMFPSMVGVDSTLSTTSITSMVLRISAGSPSLA